MVFRESDRPRGSPDDATAVVGNEGEELLQAGNELVVQTDTEGAQTHVDLDPVDITDGEDVPLLTFEGIGQTAYLSAILQSPQDEAFSFAVRWLADDGTTRAQQSFSGDTEYVSARIFTKSEDVAITATDQSDEGVGNTVEGALNWR